MQPVTLHKPKVNQQTVNKGTGMYKVTATMIKEVSVLVSEEDIEKGTTELTIDMATEALYYKHCDGYPLEFTNIEITKHESP